MMSRQTRERHPIRGFPQIDVAIVTPADYPRAIRTPGHATDPGRVRAIHPPRGASGHIPDQHAPLNRSAGQALPVRTPGHPIEEGVGVVAVPRIWTQVPVAGSQSRMALSHPELASLLPSGLHSTPYTSQRWPRKSLSGASLATSQRVTTVSMPPLASLVPSGTPGDIIEGGRVALQDPHALPPLHIPQPQRAILTATEQVRLSGVKARPCTTALWPWSTTRERPSWTSHSRIVWSKLPLASVPPSGLQATHCTRSVCPTSVWRTRSAPLPPPRA